MTIGEDQTAYFKVSGTHTIYLTGNYVVPADNGHNHEHELYDGEDEEDDYDMSPDEDELEDDEESDELDTLEDPRITEVASEDEGEPPELVKRDEVAKKEEPAKKGKNKRAREESEDEKDVPASLDDIMAKSLKPAEPTTNGETKLSKKQLKKLKNNAGKAVEAAVENKEVKKENKDVNKEDREVKKEDTVAKDSPLKGDKKVQFAKNLEQGPASSPETPKRDNQDKTNSDLKKEEGKPKASLGVKIVQGVKIDDKKLGTGPAAKKGSKVGMRYIGKLKDGKVFDCKCALDATEEADANDCQRTKRASHSTSPSEMARSSKAGTLALQVCKQAVSVASSSRRISPTARREWQGYRAIRSLPLT